MAAVTAGESRAGDEELSHLRNDQSSLAACHHIVMRPATHGRARQAMDGQHQRISVS